MKGPGDQQEPAEWVTEQIGALMNARYRDLFHEILAEGFVLEQDAKLAVATIQAQLQTQGALVVLEGREFERSVMRLIDLYQVYRITNVLGLGRFSDEIMKAEIQRRFSQRPVQTATVPPHGSDQ